MKSILETGELKESLEAALTKHGWKKKRRFFNFTTTENFIHHLPKIKDKATRELAYNNLKEYLRLINKMHESEELDAKSSDELFSEYLLPLVNTYEIRLGFALFIRLPHLLLAFIIAEAIAVGFKAPLWIHLILDISFLCYFIYQFHKRKQKKVYGLFV